MEETDRDRLTKKQRNSSDELKKMTEDIEVISDMVADFADSFDRKFMESTSSKDSLALEPEAYMYRAYIDIVRLQLCLMKREVQRLEKKLYVEKMTQTEGCTNTREKTESKGKKQRML